MPDNKLPDNEIKKALEICGTYKGKCTDCPAYTKVDRSNCKQVLKGAVDLINRLQAESERKQATIDGFTDIGKLYSEIKAEAYKEFAELAHCHCQDIINQPHNEKVKPLSWKVAYEEFDKYVDNLLKELVGENNET